MVLATHPSTGMVIGLSLSLSSHPGLESIRVRKDGEQSRLFSAFSCLLLAYKVFKISRFSKKYEECPTRVLSRAAVHGMEELGSFEFSGTTKPFIQLFNEAKLLACCSWSIFRGNSVRYEIGFRWYHQTNYDQSFKDNFCEIVETTPVLAFGSNISALESPSDTEDFIDDDFVNIFDNDGNACGVASGSTTGTATVEPPNYQPRAVVCAQEMFKQECDVGFTPTPCTFFPLPDGLADSLEKMFEEADPSVSVLGQSKGKQQCEDALELLLQSSLASIWPTGDFAVKGFPPDLNFLREITSEQHLFRLIRLRLQDQGVHRFLERAQQDSFCIDPGIYGAVK